MPQGSMDGSHGVCVGLVGDGEGSVTKKLGGRGGGLVRTGGDWEGGGAKKLVTCFHSTSCNHVCPTPAACAESSLSNVNAFTI